MSKKNYPEILQSLKDIIVKTLSAHLSQDKAHQCAHAIAESVRTEWGGEPIYIPKGSEYQLSQRDREIYAKFNGSNQHELCKQYDISYVWLCKIIKHQRRDRVKKAQIDIFPVEDGDDS